MVLEEETKIDVGMQNISNLCLLLTIKIRKLLLRRG